MLEVFAATCALRERKTHEVWPAGTREREAVEFDTANAAFEAENAGGSLSRELLFRDVWEHPADVEVGYVPVGRLVDGDAGLSQQIV